MALSIQNFFDRNTFFRDLPLNPEEKTRLIQEIESGYLTEFLTGVILESERILAIDPRLDRREILQIAARNIVEALCAEAATIRLYDPQSFRMLSYGSSGIEEIDRLSSVPAHGSIAGKVARENRSIAVPNIEKDKLYQNKDIIAKKGFHSLLAVPLRMPSFVGRERDLMGSIQIYYRKNNRTFSQVEIIRAEMLARRVSYVLAKKKILDLATLNATKEKIADKIFVKLSNREAVRLKDFFILLIPDLGEFLQMISCTLFTLSEDRQYLTIEAAYPPDLTYHESGHVFTVSHHPYFDRAVNGGAQYGDHPNERIDRNYILIKDPAKSELTSPGMREFARTYHIHSILLIPLTIGGDVRHVLTFYAGQQKLYFTDEEIELLTFFGKEIIKASKLEFLGDMLHDFKNPAVAIAGFAARSIKLLDREEDTAVIRDKLKTYLEVIGKETARLQDMAMTLTHEGREEVVDLGQTALERFMVNREAITEMKLSHIEISTPEVETGIFVFCPPHGLERVMDNLLNNASKAIPREGGTLTLRVFRDESMAALEIANTGEMPRDQSDRLMRGDVRGRGINIIKRFAQTNHGRVDIESAAGRTVITLRLPLRTA